MMRRLSRLALGLLLVAPARATWSIIVIKRSTGEVAVGCATCINDFNLLPYTPVIRPGKGVANIQSSGDVGGTRKPIVWAGFGAGDSPSEILQAIRSEPFFQNLQLGIVSWDGPPVTFSGGGAGAAVCGLAGDDGDLVYAIQGNLMTGPEVCTAAEQALLNTDGDLVSRLMAGMLAARSIGGDGRCSCPRPDPTTCGAPPPFFTKSAHTGFVVVARVGDEEGLCGPAIGCANGSYYMVRNAIGNAADIDPIFELEQKVDLWRTKQQGKPDHLLSTVEVDRQHLVADGASRATVTVALRDIDDLPLGQGGALVSVVPRHGGAPSAQAGSVTDHGDGTYSFELVATVDAGLGTWDLVVDFGGPKTRQLWPPLTMETRPLVDLFCGFHEYPGGSDLEVPFELNRGSPEAGRPYHLLGSLSGTDPGVVLGGVHVPLNRDSFLEQTWLHPGPPGFPGFMGSLDGAGRAEARLVLDAATSAALVGERLHFCALLGPPGAEVSSLARFLVVP